MLSHRWLTNGVLLFVVLVLVLLVLYTRHHATQANVLQQALTPIKPESVQEIRIQRADSDSEDIRLSRTDTGDWQLVSPLTLPARPFRVDGLLQILNRSSYIRLEDDIPDLAALRLNPPIVRLWFDSFSIGVGDIAPLNNEQRYALIGQTVYLLDNNFAQLLGRSAADFVSLFPLEQLPNLTALELPEFSLSKADIEADWQLQAPPSPEWAKQYETDATALSRFAQTWQRLQALNVSLMQADDIYQDKEKIQLHVENEIEPLVLYIVSVDAELILAAPMRGVRYHFSAAQGEDLLHLPSLTVANIQ